MRIIVAHNKYRYAGGEDSVMQAEVDMLRRAGHQVEVVEADNRSIHPFSSKLIAASSLFHSSRSYKNMSALITEFQPGILHIHNWFPLLSPSIISAAVDAGVPVVQTLHNFRMICANGNLYRDGAVCLNCVGKSFPLDAAIHSCYKGSRVGSALVSAAFSYHRLARTWDGISTFIAVSEFQRSLLIRGGVNAAQIVVKPNFVDDTNEVGAGDGGYALFVGRLTEEKGIRTVLRVWESGQVDFPLRILGDGPLREEVRQSAERLPSIQYLGHRALPQVYAAMANAKFLIFPSECLETFALTIVEAFSRGTPVLAADLESIRDLVKDGHTGYTFAAGDVLDLAAKAKLLLDKATPYQDMRQNCRAVYKARYTDKSNYGLLMDIYNNAICSAVAAESSARVRSSRSSVAVANVLGVGVHAVDMERTVGLMRAALERRQKGYICLVGAHGVMEARAHPDFRAVISGAFLAVPDGMPTVWMGHRQGLPEMRRVFGPDLMLEVLGRKDFAHLTHFFCGGAPGVAEQLRGEMLRRYPWLRIGGIFSPPFRPMTAHEEDEFVQQVGALKPDIIWVGMSTPKQESFMARTLPRLDTTLMIGVGAAFLFHTGTIADSPEWVKRAGLQWLHRLLQEPSRLWRRYGVTVPRFIFHAALQLSGLRRYPLSPRAESLLPIAVNPNSILRGDRCA